MKKEDFYALLVASALIVFIIFLVFFGIPFYQEMLCSVPNPNGIYI